MEIRYWVVNDAVNPRVCGGPSDPNSCAVADGEHWNNEVEWQYFDVYMRTVQMEGDDPWQNDPDRRRHAVNHETGHVFGLEDGGPDAPGTKDPSCVQSIMHPFYYGCDGTTPARSPYVPRYPWPQGGDFATVIDNTNRR